MAIQICNHADCFGCIESERYILQLQAENQVFKENRETVLCKNCKHWNRDGLEWHGSRPCGCVDGKFFVGGGDNNDGLYTEPEFGCVDGEEK